MLALGHQHLDLRQLARGLAVGLHRGAHRVLEQLEQDVVEVGRGVAQRQGGFLAGGVLDQCLTCKLR